MFPSGLAVAVMASAYPLGAPILPTWVCWWYPEALETVHFPFLFSSCSSDWRVSADSSSCVSSVLPTQVLCTTACSWWLQGWVVIKFKTKDKVGGSGQSPTASGDHGHQHLYHGYQVSWPGWEPGPRPFGLCSTELSIMPSLLQWSRCHQWTIS
jgi:hypothetical protein